MLSNFLPFFFFPFSFFLFFSFFFMHGTNDVCRIPSHYGTTFYNLTLNQRIHLLMTLDECSLCFICFFSLKSGFDSKSTYQLIFARENQGC